MRILLVEDEPGIAQNISAYLSQHSFAVDTATDGKSGYAMTRVVNYDVILLDWMLPEMNGLEICARIRRNDPQAAIIMLTSKNALDDTIDGLTAGADDYIVKPFALRELMARIQGLLRRKYSNQPQEGILKVADLELNLKTQEVFRAKKPIKLTRKLYQLLEILMRNKEQVVSKAEMEAHVWDAQAELWSDVVRSHILKLRQKIDQDFELKLIRTIQGVGYKISDAPNVL